MKIDIDSVRLNYVLEGREGAPVITLSHSLATDLSMWDAQIETLTRRFRVLRYETRGHGESEAPEGSWEIEDLADDVHGLLSALGIERSHFIGLSMGGMVGQMLALKHPEVLQSLVLCDTACDMSATAGAWEERIATAMEHGMEPLVAPTIDRWFSPAFIDERDDLVEPVRKMISNTPVDGYCGCCKAIGQFNVSESLSVIDMPALIIVGEDDPGTPVSAAEAIHQGIPGSELVIIGKASRHLCNIEQPEDFNAALDGFFAGLPVA